MMERARGERFCNCYSWMHHTEDGMGMSEKVYIQRLPRRVGKKEI
jgi:hypothetical protein